LAVGSKDREIKLFNLQTGEIRSITMPNEQEEVQSIEIHESRQYILIVSAYELTVLDIKSLRSVHASRQNSEITHAYFSETKVTDEYTKEESNK
jgi:hypothetical protein